MGHLQNMSDKQRINFLSDGYKRRLEANKGHNFEYWGDKHYKMLEGGWSLYNKFFSVYEKYKNITYSESIAKEIVNNLRKEGNFARIVCGYHKDKQRIKTYSIIYKSKKK